jgi:hypothetical protein
MFDNNQWKKIKITTMLHQERVIPLYTDNQYYDYQQSNDYANGGVGEVVGGPNYQVKPYFDFDSDYVVLDDAFKCELSSWFNDEYGFDLRFMSRKPRLDKDKIKYSLRAYGQGNRIYYALIPIYFAKLFERYNGIVDASVYSTGRVMLTLGNKRKINTDVPELKMDNPDDDIMTVFATYISEEYVNLDDCVNAKVRDGIYAITLNKVAKRKEIGIPVTTEEEEFKPVYYKLNKYIQYLSKERSTSYDLWSAVNWSIINIGNANDLTRSQIERLIHLWSAKADNYDDYSVDDWINKNIDNVRETGYGWNYLNECLKKDDSKYYNSIALSYYNKKKDFELTHIKCMYPPTIITDNGDKIEIANINNAIKTYGHIDCYVKEKDNKGNDKLKKVKFINEWLKDHHIRICNNMTNKPPPLQVNDNEYNLWTGFSIAKTPYIPNHDVLRLFLEFGTNLLGEEYMMYSIAIFALRLQTPAKRANVLQLLYSEDEGTGKNTWFNIFMNIFGKDKFAQLESANDLFSAHSSEEENRLFILVDEAKGIDNYSNADKLKSRITCDRLRVNPKGIQAYEIPNNCDYLETTNNWNCLPQTDQSRRFAPIQVSNFFKGNTSFFNYFNDKIVFNEEALRCIFEYLMNFDVAKIVPSGNFQNHIPDTDFRKDLNTDNRNRIDLFLEAIAYDYVEVDNEVNKPELFQKFNTWMINNRFTNNYNAISFGRKISNIIKSKDLPITVNKRKYMIDIAQLKSKY